MKPVSIERRISEFMIMPCLRKMVSGVSSWFTFKFSQFFLKTSFSKFFFSLFLTLFYFTVLVFLKYESEKQLVNRRWSVWVMRKGERNMYSSTISGLMICHQSFRNSHCTTQQHTREVSVTSLALCPSPTPSVLMVNKSWHLFLLSTGGASSHSSHS